MVSVAVAEGLELGVPVAEEAEPEIEEGVKRGGRFLGDHMPKSVTDRLPFLNHIRTSDAKAFVKQTSGVDLDQPVTLSQLHQGVKNVSSSINNINVSQVKGKIGHHVVNQLHDQVNGLVDTHMAALHARIANNGPVDANPEGCNIM